MTTLADKYLRYEKFILAHMNLPPLHTAWLSGFLFFFLQNLATSLRDQIASEAFMPKYLAAMHNAGPWDAGGESVGEPRKAP